MNSANGRHAALVIGAGIAGIQAALDIADAGFKVYLVEKSPSIGGRMSQLDKTFPTLDCSSCILTPKMADVPRNPNIELLTCTQVKNVEGHAGDFHVTLERAPRYVDEKNCTGCGLCTDACPVITTNIFNAGLDTHKAIYRVFPQAVPAAFVIEKKTSPCKVTCPAHIPVQGYVALIAEGKFREAYQRVLDAGVPFVGTLGRVCYHPCEAECKRADWDEAISICALKRFAYDEGALHTLPEPFDPTQGKPAPVHYAERVAVIGAGPAGLTTAYNLTLRGYKVTVFDALPAPGGMLAAGIPEYRLPRNVLDDEINSITALGVELKMNTPIGRDGGPSLEDLQKEYQAVFMAIGAHGSSRLGVPNEDIQGVFQAVPFLRHLNMGHEAKIGKRVAVIGGGNSAIDAARCALRLGSEVQLVYRRSRVEMPAAAWEVASAEEEGVKLTFLSAPVRVIEKDGRVAGIECVRMKLGEPDSSERRRPVPVEGSEYILEVDTVIAAIGQTIESAGLGVETKWDRVIVDPLTLETSVKGVFAGGDAVIGPASVVEAIGAGIQAAESIHRYLRGLDMREGRTKDYPKAKDIEVVPTSPVKRAPRERVQELPAAERVSGFREVELGLTKEQAIAEAQRCLNCAVCSECNQCVTACTRGAIIHDDKPRRVDVDVDAILVATGFDVFDPHRKPELGYGKYPQVITGLEFERLASASGPTAGKIIVNGQQPKKITFIQCVGSRDRTLNLPNCSRVCCMAVAKQAHLAHDRLPGAEITVFYMDVRAFGKGFEEFYDRVRKEGILYRRGNPSEVLRRGDKLIIRAEDTLLGEQIELESDLVVLAAGLTPRADASDLTRILNLQQGADGYFQEAHPKLRTVESNIPGMFLAGCCQGPKDIPDTVAHAKAAASAAMILLRKNSVPEIQVIEPTPEDFGVPEGA
ncbi:MAG: FAD-dependent oxidoreductase [Chloroflexi bacterium]|nr:FAD-dependent oxidoreductase [Chloroflexota bacterium]